MASPSSLQIRQLGESDVPAILRVIHDARRDYGLEGRVAGHAHNDCWMLLDLS